MNPKLLSHLRSLRRRGPLILLDSQSACHPASQKSYLAAVPDARIEAFGNQVTLCHPDGTREQMEADPWEALKRFRASYPGWHFGWLGYDLKNFTEKLTSGNPDPVNLPDLFFIRPTELFRIDAASRSIHALMGNRVPPGEQGEAQPFKVANLQSDYHEAEYLALVDQARHYIKEGDFYEINLSHQLRADFTGDSLDLYTSMRRRGPVPFGAYVHGAGFSICCASPERFLCKKGTRLLSEPIKGTIRRGSSQQEDLLLKKEILYSVKNRAENLMIVDLVRNDLSRIAKAGTVHTGKFYELQTFNTLHQMVSAVTAEMGETIDAVDAIKACFPMGSMTGAPKIRSMEVIEQLESRKRGIYSGAIGYFTPDDDFDLNVVIRTAVVKGDKLYYSIGGAITADSVPLDEWEETWVKARALTSFTGEMNYDV
ncbi:MAG: anthranilate synthase component I family protein [Balneolales bacterium]